MGTLASVHIYPLKGCRAIDLPESAVAPWGLADDRRWMVVNAEGRFFSRREHAGMARLVVVYGQRPGIHVSSDGFAPLWAATPGAAAEMLKVSVWSSRVLAAAAGPDADAWFSAFMGEPARLVYLDDPTRRPVNPEFGAAGDVVSFADGFPLLATSADSLAQLGDWLAAAGDQPVPMNRFRPSVVLAGFEPWAPLKLLGARRRFGQALVFGQNLIPDSPGWIRVGDPVEVTEYAS